MIAGKSMNAREKGKKIQIKESRVKNFKIVQQEFFQPENKEKNQSLHQFKRSTRTHKSSLLLVQQSAVRRRELLLFGSNSLLV